MNRRAFIPSPLAALEDRIALSQFGFADAPAPAPPPALVASQTMNLYGFALGHDKTVGTVHHFSSTDNSISPLGTISLTGSLVIPRKPRVNRLVHGAVTISNAQGSLVVSLTGKVTVYKGHIPFATGNLTYKIVSGTGADQGATGTGSVLYGPGPALSRSRFLLDFGNFPPPP